MAPEFYVIAFLSLGCAVRASHASPRSPCGDAGSGAGCGKVSLRTRARELQAKRACVHQADCSVSAWCKNLKYEAYCNTNGEQGYCPEPQCLWSNSDTPATTTTTPPAAVQCDVKVKSGDYCFKFWEGGIDTLTCHGVTYCVKGNDATFGLQAGACCTSSSAAPVSPEPTPAGSTPEPTPADPMPEPVPADPTPAPTPSHADSAAKGDWTWWPVSGGITYHGPAYSIERYCASNAQPVGDMCWRLEQDQVFKNNILPAFCARTDVKIAFGHPDIQKCGECSEVRVKRRDGGYNYVTVMTTDHPETTNTSPELSDSGKIWLDQDTINGVACPGGGGPDSADCAKGDRLNFEYRKVPCVAR